MRKLMIAGALLGFLIGIGFGLVRAHSWPVILGRASAALFCSGMLFRWWGQAWVRNLRASYCDQTKAAVVKAAAVHSKP